MKYLSEALISFLCTNSSQKISLLRGLYKFDVYGAQGGGSKAGKGGYSAGVLNLIEEETVLYVYVGCRGHEIVGGFNGGGTGGRGEQNKKLLRHGGGVGGSSDIRIDPDDLDTRIIVAGGGGGACGDGWSAGGNGRGLTGGKPEQKFPEMSLLDLPNKTYGYAKLLGQSSIDSEDLGSHSGEGDGGGGGGWFGGFASYNNNGGASGGSSFALTYNSTIPQGLIHIYNKNYESVQSGTYAFNPKESYYIFTNVTHQRGVWYGNGWIKISQLQNYEFLLKEITIKCNIIITPTFFSIFLFLS